MSETRTIDIVISPGWGAGLATWEFNVPNLERCPGLVEYVRNTPPDQRDESAAMAAVVKSGYCAADAHIYWGGLKDAEVVEVTEPYMLNEYDGWESVVTLGDLS